MTMNEAFGHIVQLYFISNFQCDVSSFSVCLLLVFVTDRQKSIEGGYLDRLTISNRQTEKDVTERLTDIQTYNFIYLKL